VLKKKLPFKAKKVGVVVNLRSPKTEKPSSTACALIRLWILKKKKQTRF
jgi:hypothetical protein